MTPSDVAFHEWTIEEREVRRHVSRRGRKHAFESIDPARTALVVIDIVPFFVRESPYVRGIVPRVNALAEGLRLAGGTVAWVVPGYQTPSATEREFFGDVVAESYARSGGEGEPSERLWSGLAFSTEDLVVEKTARSAFFPGSSALPDLLTERSLDTLLVTGTVANVCVEASVRDAATLGYRSYGDVRSTSEVLELIRSGS